MKKILPAFILFMLLVSQVALSQKSKDKPAYQLFSKKCKQVNYRKMLDELEEADVVMFGEQHNDPIAHWLQLELTKDLHKKHQQNFALGAEMFESDVQLILDEYLTDKIPESNFEQEARPWTNYKTDYRPLVRYAKEMGLSFIATNVPRRYAAAVSSGSLKALDNFSGDAKKYLAPLPVLVDMELPGYKNILAMFGSSTHGNTKSQNIVQAQALKDATMAHFILKEANTGKKVLHFNGAYHSDNYEGIGYYLKQHNPKLKVLTITTVQQSDLDKLEEEYEGKANFILVVPATMTKTY